MSYLFDSDVCIDILRSRDRKTTDAIIEKFGNLTVLECLTSVIVEAELRVGVHKARSSPAFNGKLEQKLETFLARFSVLPIDSQVAKKYAEIRSELEQIGMSIAGNDLFIAATAMTYDLTLLTRNRRDYARIPRLRFESFE